MNNNGMNKGDEIKKNMAKKAATVYAGPLAGKAVDIASKTKLGKAALQGNNDLINKNPGMPLGMPGLPKMGNSKVKPKEEGLPKDGLEDESSKSILPGSRKNDSKSPLSNLGNNDNENIDSESEGLFENDAGQKIFSFMKKHWKVSVGIAGSLIVFLVLILAIPIIVASIGGGVIEFFTGIGDYLIGFFDPDEQTLIEKYDQELKDVKENIFKSKGICIDENLITATLTVDVDAQDYANLEEKNLEINEDISVGNPDDEKNDNGIDTHEANQYAEGDRDYKKMTKEVGILANMQIKNVMYGHNKDLTKGGSDCRSEEEGSLDELVTEENLERLDFPGWWNDFLKIMKITDAKKIEKYVSDSPEKVAKHDLSNFQRFFTKKINEEKNYEYHIYTPAYYEECPTGSNGQRGNCHLVCDKLYVPSKYEVSPTLSIGTLNTMEESVYYWNLVNSFIPNYYNEFLPQEDGEERDAAIKKIAEDIYLLYNDLGPGQTCSTNVINSCDYAFDEGGNKLDEDLDITNGMSNVKVELLECQSTNSTGTILDLEEYIRGVVAHEIRAGKHGGTNYEAAKAQAIMARTYVLQYADIRTTTASGSTLLKIQNCDYKQQYGDPSVIEKELGADVYEQWLRELASVEGMVLVDSSGNMIKNKEGTQYMYTNVEQEEWMASSNDYRTMLMQTYGNADNLYSNCTLVGAKDGVGPGTKAGDVTVATNCDSYDRDRSYWGDKFSFGQCTWYAWGRAKQILVEDLGYSVGEATNLLSQWHNVCAPSDIGENCRSDGGMWYAKAVKSGVFDYAKGVNPAGDSRGFMAQIKPGALVSWKGKPQWDGCERAGCGHIAVIESVEYNSDGSIKSIATSNGGGGKGCFMKTYYSLDSFWTDNGGKDYIDGFIYLNR